MATQNELVRPQVQALLDILKASTAKYLASKIGSTRQAVSFALRKLAEEGKVHQAKSIRHGGSDHMIWVSGQVGDRRGLREVSRAQAQLEGREPPNILVETLHKTAQYRTTFAGGQNPWTGVHMK